MSMHEAFIDIYLGCNKGIFHLLNSISTQCMTLHEVLMHKPLYIITMHRFLVHRRHEESDNMYVCKLINITNMLSQIMI